MKIRTSEIIAASTRVPDLSPISYPLRMLYLSEYDHYTIPQWEVCQLADHYCADSIRWGKSIFFFHTVHDCFALNSLLESRGIRADVVTGNSDRETQLRAFQMGELQGSVKLFALARNCGPRMDQANGD